MKISTVKKDLHKLSSTLYGRERWKLVLTFLKKYQEGGKNFAAEDLHFIDTQFYTKKEADDYRRMLLDFYVCNFILIPMVLDAERDVVDFLDCFQFDYEKMDLDKLSKKIQFYFEIAFVVEEINVEYSFDLFLLHNREKIQIFNAMFLNVIAIIKEHYCFNPKTQNFTAEELAEIRPFVQTILYKIRRIAQITF